MKEVCNLEQAELHTVIAALHFFVFMGQCEPELQVDWVERNGLEQQLSPPLPRHETEELVKRLIRERMPYASPLCRDRSRTSLS